LIDSLYLTDTTPTTNHLQAAICLPGSVYHIGLPHNGTYGDNNYGYYDIGRSCPLSTAAA